MSIERFFGYSIVAGILLGLFSACIEEQDIFLPDTADPIALLDFQSPLRDFYEAQGIGIQTFTIDPTRDEDIESAGKMKIFLPKGLFLDTMGNPVTSAVHLQVLEALSRGDQIQHNIATGDAQPLYTLDYGYFIAARTASGAPMRLDPQKNYEVFLPVSLPLPGLMMVKGQWPNSRYFDWVPAGGEIRTAAYTLSNNERIEGIAFRANQLFWSGIGRNIATSGSVTELCVASAGAYDPQNTSVFFVLERLPMIVELPWAAGSSTFCIEGLPSGERGRLILISKRPEGTWHFDQRQITIGGIKQIEVLEPATSSAAAIREVLDNL